MSIGESLKHFVPNSKLHQIKQLSDLVEFYSAPIRNISKYAQLARDEHIPQNIAIREHPARFHPNDTEAPHGGFFLVLLRFFFNIFNKNNL